MYVGGRTPNAFNNNPVDVIGGVKIYPSALVGNWRQLIVGT